MSNVQIFRTKQLLLADRCILPAADAHMYTTPLQVYQPCGVATCIADAMNTVSTSAHYNMTGAYGQVHSAVLHANKPSAAAAISTAAAGTAGTSPFATAVPDLPAAAAARGFSSSSLLPSDRPRSFISAACAATAAAAAAGSRHSFGGSSTGSASRTAHHHRPGLDEGLSSLGSGQIRVGGRNSVQIMRSVWNQHVHQTQQQQQQQPGVGPGPSRLRLETGRDDGVPGRGAAVDAVGATAPAAVVGIHGHDAAAFPVRGDYAGGVGVAGEGVLVDAGRLLQDLDTMSDLSTEDEDMTQEEVSMPHSGAVNYARD